MTATFEQMSGLQHLQQQWIELLDGTFLTKLYVNLPLVGIMATVMTIAWVYLWTIHPNRPMTKKKVQTWWQLGGYVVLFALGMISMYVEQLLDCFSRLAEVWHYTLQSRVSILYFEVEIAWYTSSLICTLINRESKDFRVMLFHHIITPAEVYFSHSCGYGAVGMVVMILHDTSDIFLHLAKSFYHQTMSRATDITFLIFTIVFFITRLVLLPMAPYSYFFVNTYKHDTCGDIISGTCFVLVGLHLYWFHLIVLMLIKFARAGNVKGDIREETQNYEEKPNSNNTDKDTTSAATSVKTNGAVITPARETSGESGSELTRRVTRSSSNKKKAN